MGHTFGKPHRLGGVGEFAEEHVEHGEDVSRKAHDKEPNAGLKFLFTTVGGRDEDVDEHGHEEQTDGQRLKAVEHGGHAAGFGIDVEETEDERQQVAGHENSGEQHSHHGRVGLAGHATVAVSGGGDHAAADHAVKQGDGQEVEGGVGQRRAVIVGPADAGKGIKGGWVVVVPAAQETKESSEHEPEHTEVHPGAGPATVLVVKDVDQAGWVLLQDEQADLLQGTTDGANALGKGL